MDEKPYENILIYDTSYKYLISPKPLNIRFEEIDGFAKVCNRTRDLVLFDLNNMIPFTMGLDTL